MLLISCPIPKERSRAYHIGSAYSYIKTQDIVNMARKFCSENNIELSDVTSFIGNKLGLF